MDRRNKQDSEIQGLIETINYSPDPVHAGFTPAVVRLAALGLRGARAVVDLLDAPDFASRKHAQVVIEQVVKERHGWISGQAYPDPSGQEKTQALLEANGNYQADDPSEERKQAIEKWRRWLEAQED